MKIQLLLHLHTHGHVPSTSLLDVTVQGWHNITVAEELKRAVLVASGFQGNANTVEGNVNTVERTSNAVDRNVTITGPPLHPASPRSMIESPKTPHISKPSSFPTCLEQLSRSTVFSLNFSHSQSNSLSEVKVKVEPADYFGAETGLGLILL